MTQPSRLGKTANSFIFKIIRITHYGEDEPDTLNLPPIDFPDNCVVCCQPATDHETRGIVLPRYSRNYPHFKHHCERDYKIPFCHKHYQMITRLKKIGGFFFNDLGRFFLLIFVLCLWFPFWLAILTTVVSSSWKIITVIAILAPILAILYCSILYRIYSSVNFDDNGNEEMIVKFRSLKYAELFKKGSV